MKKIRVYISGPITNDKEGYEAKFKKAVDYINNRETDGYKVFEAVNPLTLEVDYDPNKKWTTDTWVKYIKKDIDLLTTCDAMVLMPGWDYSAGCIVEYITAKKLGIHIMTLHDIFGIESDDDRHPDEFPTFHARFIRDTLNEIRNISKTLDTWNEFELKIQRAVKDSKNEELSKDVGDYYIKFENIHEEGFKETVRYLTDFYFDNKDFHYYTDTSIAKHLKEKEAKKILKELLKLKKENNYKWTVNIVNAKKEDKKFNKPIKNSNWEETEGNSKLDYKFAIYNKSNDQYLANIEI